MSGLESLKFQYSVYIARAVSAVYEGKVGILWCGGTVKM
jgi:hypothetical protein